MAGNDGHTQTRITDGNENSLKERPNADQLLFVYLCHMSEAMEPEQIFKDKTLKPKEKTEHLASMVLENKIAIDELIKFAGAAKDPVKATCIESLEFATQKNPGIITSGALSFITDSLKGKAPRVKWESAKVIGNCIHLFPDKIDAALKNLLDNSEDEGTVVRWSAAFAIGQILKLKTARNADLIPAVKAIIEREEKNSIKKIYLDALKKAI